MSTSGFAAELAGLRDASQFRERRTLESAQGAHIRMDGRDIVSFASNDYLGLANDARVLAAAIEGVQRHGVGSGASHLLSGHFASHARLEARLAEFAGMDKALYFGSGYLANLGILTALADRHSAIFADKLNHACLNDGAFLSRAAFIRYPHLDLATLEEQLSQTPRRKRIIVTDAVFSMDGDVAPLPGLLALAEKFDTLLVVDDAHGFGVFGPGGRGSLAHYKLASPRIVYMATLGKAAGVHGAFVAGANDVIEWLLQNARSYLFATASPPALAHALLASIDIIEHDDTRRAQLGANIRRLRASLDLQRWRPGESSTAIQPILIGGNVETLAASSALYERGIWAPAIRPPTVASGTSRLRISLSAAHSPDDIALLVNAIHDVERRLA
jgi:8-amino-7-oxononanoate synthase